MDVPLWVAVAAGAPGVLALVATVFLWTTLRRERAATRVLLPDGSHASLVDRQATLQRGIERCEQGLLDLQSLVEQQGETVERGLRTTLRFLGLVRYDAYRDMGGQQSWSIALLDGNSTGAVITSLHARDHARVYLKQVSEGEAVQRLSPEEVSAMEIALGRRPPQAPPPPEEAGE